MKKNVLIPTDFSIESLKLLKACVENSESESVNIIFLHCVYLSDSIFDLLFFSKKDLIASLLNSDFSDGCKILQNKYSNRINSIRIEIFAGGSQQAFHNFLEGNQINEILIPKNYSFQKVNKNSFNPQPYLQKCRVPVTEVVWDRARVVPEKNKLAEIFLL